MSTQGQYAAPSRRQEHRAGVTGPDGNVTFTWPPGAFTAPPVVTVAVQPTGGGFCSARIAANSPTATTVHVDQSSGVTLLGIGVLAVGAAAAGVTVHAIAMGA